MVGFPGTKGKGGLTVRQAVHVAGSRLTVVVVIQLVAPPSQCVTQPPEKRRVQNG